MMNKLQCQVVDRKTVEKNRRILMKGLCLKLVSLIPPTYFKTSHQHLLSQPDQVDHAVSYITQLSQWIEKLKKKKEGLASAATSSQDHRARTDDGDQGPRKVAVEVRESGSSIEVTLISGVHKSFMLHEVLSIIEQEGAEVVSVNLSTVGGKTFHTIHARVKICRVGVETSRVRQRFWLAFIAVASGCNRFFLVRLSAETVNRSWGFGQTPFGNKTASVPASRNDVEYTSSPYRLIIGAGLSGISAGKTLHGARISNIMILEADSQIDGRIRTAELGGYTAETGANWLFGGGPKSSRLFEIANHIGLNSRFSDFNYLSSNAYKQEGGLYSKQEVEEALKAAESRMEFCTRLSSSATVLGSADDDGGSDVSISAAQQLVYVCRVPRTPLEMVIDYFQNDYEEGEPPTVTSLKYTIPRQEYMDFGYKTYFVADPRGFGSIVHYIAKQFLSHHQPSSTHATNQLTIDDPRLKLDQVVREINHCENGARVKTEDGSEYHAKYAIVSVSIGVLQSNLIQFTPNLPEWKAQAVKEFYMGTFTKIFLRFPHKFWPSDPGTEFFLYAHEWRGYYPIWHHLEHVMPGSNIFMAVTGDESRRIHKLTDDKIQEQAMGVLRKMFGNEIPDPEQLLVPRWLSNKFFLGSYSSWPAGYTTSSQKKLRESVGPIFFTGEHTCAYSAGVDTANELVKILT